MNFDSFVSGSIDRSCCFCSIVRLTLVVRTPNFGQPPCNIGVSAVPAEGERFIQDL